MHASKTPIIRAFQIRTWAATLAAIFFCVNASFAKTVNLTMVDNRTAISLVQGDTLVVTLASPIPETYLWVPERTVPLTAIGSEPAPKDGKGAQTFRFNAATVGAAALTLNFAPRQPGAAPQVTQSFSVEVTVASGAPASSVLIGAYKGTTACADCSGIQTELWLYAKGANDFTDTMYLSTRTYLRGPGRDQSFTDRGEWAVLRGDAADPNATVYALDPDHPDQAQYLLLQPGGGSLTGLDRQMKPIDAPPMYQLVLKRE